jgi:DNA-binding transcriptional LysR family regulator
MRNNAIDLSLLLCFRVVYQTLSLTKAGEKLNLSKASVSKKLMALEDELGGKLFIRSTRKMSPTNEAHLLYEKVDLIFSATGEIDSLFKDNSSPKGIIKITAPQSMSVAFLGKIIIDFQNIHPEISVDLVSTNSVLDVVEDNIDLSLRVNPPQNSSLVGKKIGSYGLHLVATPEYIKKNPVKNLKDIKSHRFMAISAHLKDWKAKIDVSSHQNSLNSNDSILVGHLIRQGLVLGLRSSWDVKSELRQGKLVEVLPTYSSQYCGDVWLLSHPAKAKLARVQALANFLQQELKNYLN